MRPPKDGMSHVRYHQPEALVSWMRRTEQATSGNARTPMQITNARPKMRPFASSPTRDASMAKIMNVPAMNRSENNRKNQNSERDARPSNTAYLRKQVRTAVG